MHDGVQRKRRHSLNPNFCVVVLHPTGKRIEIDAVLAVGLPGLAMALVCGHYYDVDTRVTLIGVELARVLEFPK